MDAPGHDSPGPLSDADAERLLAAIDAYDADDNRYDEVFTEIGQRITDSQEAGKLDLAALITWKRSAQGAWVKSLLATPETLVRSVTRKAFAADGDLAVLQTLAALPGFAVQGPIATALMAAYDPREWAVLDSRATTALADLGRPVGNQRGKTLRYLAAARRLRDELAARRPRVTARDVDKGLFMLGAPRRRAEASG
jgi:hypothetical protein